MGERISHVVSWMKLDGMRFYHTIQNNVQFKTYGLFISGIFQLIFSDHSGPQVNKITENETG